MSVCLFNEGGYLARSRWGGGVPGKVQLGGGVPSQVQAGGTPQPGPGGGGGTLPGVPRLGHQKECLIRRGRYASCVHAGGLSCLNYETADNREIHALSIPDMYNLTPMAHFNRLTATQNILSKLQKQI